MSSIDDQHGMATQFTNPQVPISDTVAPRNIARRVRARVAAWSAPVALPPSVPQKKLTLMAKTDLLRNMVIGNYVNAAGRMIDELLSDKGEWNLDLAGFTIQDVSGNGLLQIAALRNYDIMTTLLLDKGFDINNIDNNHGTALQGAIYMDHISILNILLGRTEDSKGGTANVDTTGGYYGCALQVAAFKGSVPLIEILLCRGANVNLCCGRSKYGTALQAAARTGLPSVVKPILDRTADVDAEGGVYGTALQAAAKGTYTNATIYLRQLSRGRVLTQATEVPRKADPSSPNYPKVVELLLSRDSKVNKPGGRLGSPVNAAASSGNFLILKLLVERHCAQEPPAQEDEACRNERKSLYGRALLSAITQPFNKERLPLVRLLIKNGADVNYEAGTCLHNKPLTAAAAMNDKSVVREILKQSDHRKAMMDADSGIFGSALRAALSAEPKAAKDTAIYLIEEGTDLRQGDESYGNILHLAAFANLSEIVEKLIQDYQMEVNTLDWNGQTALHIAAYRGFESVVNILLKNGANPLLKDVWGDTALDIVEQTMEKESHPGPSLVDLKTIRQALLEQLLHQEGRGRKQSIGPFKGPPTTKKAEGRGPKHGKAKPVFESPTWNPGLNFKGTIVDFLVKQEEEHVLVKELLVDDLLYRKGAIDEAMELPEISTSTQEGSITQPETSYKRNLRWIHIPTNNMTWAEMLIKVLWAEAHPDTTCKSFWGTDPYFVSPDLAPHARFVAPQCGRLINDSMDNPTAPSDSSIQPINTMFLAMPYIHWESYRAQENVSKLLDNIKEDASTNRILKKGHTWRTTKDYMASPTVNISDSLQREAQPTAKPTNLKGMDYDDELLDKYLFKRWPLHLRRTLDQYYYSYLADTKTRDGDQVIMRSRNHALRREAEFTANFLNNGMKRDVSTLEGTPSLVQAKNAPVHRDDNSPIVVVDQLWLWVVKKDLIITCFPQRRSNKHPDDLDHEDRTDILKTILTYLHSTKRHPIQHAYDLCELIVSQTVGILHRSDMIPELDFLKIFATQADWAIDQVMQGLHKFVDSYKEFMAWLDKKHQDPGQYVKQFEQIFSITNETELLREIQDMEDELNMLAAVFTDQTMVLEKAGKDIARDRSKMDKTKSSTFNFEQQSQKHSRHVERMKKQASQAYDNLKDLLELKQQQANVLEARVSRNQVIASKRTGKTVMVFTIVTIIFLPLTFITTIFTLPVMDFPRFNPETLDPKSDGQLKGTYVFGWITGFTMVLAIPLVIMAYKIEHLEWCWEKIKKGRRKVFPLHLMDKNGIPAPEDGDDRPKWVFRPFYFGGPLPRRRTMINDL